MASRNAASARTAAAAAAAAAATAADSPAPAYRLADLGQQQLAVVAESGAALMRGFQTMRGIQDQATQQILRRHASAPQPAKGSPPGFELLAAQTALLQQDFADTMRCWQDLVGEAIEMHTELLGCGARLVNTEDVFAAMRLVHA